ncbi:MAG: DUF1905 domain-containing protein [Cyclobacteriaceae bacterium]|nr:DUF1905 domain-containing protein [Cyclobacteriaceae bacterium]
MTRFNSTLQNFNSRLWGYHIPVPASIGNEFVTGNDRRVWCTIDDIHEMQCALMPYPSGFFILLNKNLVNKLGLVLNAEVSVALKKDTSEYGMEIPETFRTLMDQDQEGACYFETLTPGKKRTLIYAVAKVKNIDRQINKGLAILEHLKLEKGKVEFKKLNLLIKDYNQRSKLKE